MGSFRENISATRGLLSDAVRHLHAATPPTETVTPSSQHGSSVLSRTPAAAQRQQEPSVLSRMPAGGQRQQRSTSIPTARSRQLCTSTHRTLDRTVAPLPQLIPSPEAPGDKLFALHLCYLSPHYESCLTRKH